MLNEDALATIGALAAVQKNSLQTHDELRTALTLTFFVLSALSQANPSLPNPSADNDLWSGSFALASASLTSDLSFEQRAAASVVIDEHGGMELSADVSLSELPATLSLSGSVSPAGDTELQLEFKSLTLTLPEDVADAASSLMAIKTYADAAGLSLERSADEKCVWASTEPIPAITLGQIYLDQDCAPPRAPAYNVLAPIPPGS